MRALAQVRGALLAWYDELARPLPWRQSRDPYRVWVSEVMLQQTRMQVVVPAYRRFVRAFPTMTRLAAATEDEVLSLWSGLGYYARVRALHRAARELHERGERFPRVYDEARRLPGVGAYTAAAVLSIAYGEPHAAVDGNVVRVLSRLARLSRPDGRGEPHASLAAELLEPRRAGDWNQSMMELGETVCLPQRPRCGECPLRRWCEARLNGEVELYPAPKKRRQVERLGLELSLVRDRRGRTLLERGAFPHLRHMWLPLTAVGRGFHPPPTRPSDASRAARSAAARGVEPPPYILFKHAILHRTFDVALTVRTATAAELRGLLRPSNGAERRLFTADEIRAIGRSSLLTKALAHVDAQHP